MQTSSEGLPRKYEKEVVSVILVTCESCGRHYDELFITGLKIKSGQVVFRCLCEDCLSYIENRRNLK